MNDFILLTLIFTIFSPSIRVYGKDGRTIFVYDGVFNCVVDMILTYFKK